MPRRVVSASCCSLLCHSASRRGGRGLVDVEVVEVAIDDQSGRPFAAERRRALEQLSFGPDPDRRLEHQARLLGERHLREEVIDPLLDRTPGILVGIQPAVAVEVAHAPAVDLEHRRFHSPSPVDHTAGGSGA